MTIACTLDSSLIRGRASLCSALQSSPTEMGHRGSADSLSAKMISGGTSERMSVTNAHLGHVPGAKVGSEDSKISRRSPNATTSHYSQMSRDSLQRLMFQCRMFAITHFARFSDELSSKDGKAMLRQLLKILLTRIGFSILNIPSQIFPTLGRSVLPRMLSALTWAGCLALIALDLLSRSG